MMVDFCFPGATRDFLAGIAGHNEKAWFDANRSLYDAGYIEAGRACVTALGPELLKIDPGVKFEPKVNGSMMRINRDIRFSKDKRPYKTHLDLWFWHGETRGWQHPGFWFRLTADEVMMGVGIHRFEPDQLESYRQSVIHPRSGKALLAAVDAVRGAGDYWVGEKTRKLMPRGYATEPDRAEYLLYEGLTGGITLPADIAYQPGFGALCLEHFAATWPLGRWLLAEVVE